MGFDLRELVLHVVGVHGSDLLTGWSAQDLDDLDQLINAGFTWEERLSKHQLRHNATSRPDICGRS